MQGTLFRSQEFAASSPATVTIIFICPYGAPIQTVEWAIRRLLKAGYHVIAYETTTGVFMNADPTILSELIFEVREDIRSQIAKLGSQGVTEFGFFGSSLGAFILYNCIGHKITELRWGVFNTGGNIAQGMWRLREARRRHIARGWSLPRLEAVWFNLQWPDFGQLDGCRFVFVSSRRDKVAPLNDVWQYLEPMRRAGAEVSVHEVPAISHLTAVGVGLWKAPRFVRMVRAGDSGTLPPRGGRVPGFIW